MQLRRRTLAASTRTLTVLAALLASGCSETPLPSAPVPTDSASASFTESATPAGSSAAPATPSAAPTPSSIPDHCTYGRSTVDQPDELTGGGLVHLVYALPLGTDDRELDTAGQLAASFEIAQDWLAEETDGSRLRVDACGGVPEVTFVQLPRTDAEYLEHGAFIRDEVEADLIAMGFSAPNKILAVYYDGGSALSCGAGPYPPELVGTVAIQYLRGEPPGAPACETNPLPSRSGPGYWEFAMLHEILHTLGFVASCAPNEHMVHHVSTPPTDIMWAGEGAWRPGALDPGRDDYFDHGRADCLDLARSAFIDPLPDPAEFPPGW